MCRRFKSCPRYECDVSGHRGRPNPCRVGSAVAVLAVRAVWLWDGLVALGRVEDELAEELAGGGVDDADVAVVDQDDDAGSGVGSTDSDGVEPALVAQGDLAAGVHAVAAYPVVGVDLVTWGGLGTGRVGGGW